jgi:hypothetical protein
MALSSLWARITRTDHWLMLLLLLVTIGSLLLSLGRSVGRSVVIYEGERIAFTAPLTQERRIELDGPLGATQVEISAGRARVVSSPCSRKICIEMGDIHRSGDLLACVPNRVVIRIEGDGEGGAYDLLSR